jgi:hypothetical protein
MPRSLILLRMIAGLWIGAIIVLSVVPGTYRPHVLPLPMLEHLATYFVAGTVLVISFL